MLVDPCIVVIDLKEKFALEHFDVLLKNWICNIMVFTSQK